MVLMNLTGLFDKLQNVHMMYLLAIVAIQIPIIGGLFIFLGEDLLVYNFFTLLLISTCGGVALGLPAYLTTIILDATDKDRRDPELNELVWSYVANAVVLCFIIIIFEAIFYIFFKESNVEVFIKWLLGISWVIIPGSYIPIELTYRKYKKNKKIN